MTSERPQIITLPPGVANRIAAGEVVERPAAVVKELIENALDAGAAKVNVIIEEAGRTLIKVTDDGGGMAEADLALALGRHATSKIKRFEDLETLQTFGFRGEALPSIAAVSRLEITSRTADQEVGNQLKAAGGLIENVGPAAAAVGTSIAVSHLFYNVPARRKFLRSDATEFKWIALIFRHFTVAFPEVTWELYRDNELIVQLPAGDIRRRLAGLFGDDMAEDLIEIDQIRSWLKVSGFISPPSLTQRTNQDQYLFLNRRPIYHPRLNRAVYTACEPYLMTGGHPLYALFLETTPDQYDINVHPAKKEVKFADESGAFSAVWAAVRNALSSDQAPADITKGDQAAAVSKPGAVRVPVDSPSHLTPWAPLPRQHHAPRGSALPFPGDKRTLRESEIPRKSFDPSATSYSEGFSTAATTGESTGPVIWQIFDSYIISPLKTGLVFIDQHIAHERVLYERALNALEKSPLPSQQLLFPETFRVNAEDQPTIEEVLPLLREMGFEVQSFGPREYRILAAPAGLRIAGEKELLLGIIQDYVENASIEKDPRHRLAASFACRSAIKAGQALTSQEMQRLIEELFQTDDPEFCPHGRPIYHVLGLREIEKWFKR
ncbi:MAG: DNA mismatch repair endonuclease MutL [Calditrichota bacterium]